MHRFLTILPLLFCQISIAQKQYNVLDWKADATVNAYNVQLMHQQYDERRINFQKALSSKAAMLLYQKEVRKKFITLLGEMPAASPLNATVTGVISKERYHIESIVYESFKDHHVTANLYIPSGKGPFPAALLFCGHEDVSKATESYQKTAILFAKNGFVVLVIDPISQSERYQIVDEKGKPLTRGGTTEHTLLNEACNLFGNSTPQYELWDNVRGLDYLVTRKEVDTSRIGCLGNSGGGMQTIYFAAYDQRVKVFAPCSYLDNRERVLEMSGPADGCAQIPNEGKMQLELDDYLIAAAPKPILVLAGRYDFIDFNGTTIAYKELEKVYKLLGQSSKLKMFAYDDGHGISAPKRDSAVAWFRRWFYKTNEFEWEDSVETMKDTELFATNTGNVNTSYPDEVSLVKRNLALFDAKRIQRLQFALMDKEKKKQKIKELLSLTEISEETDMGVITVATDHDADSVVNNGITFHKAVLRAEGVVPLPILGVLPAIDTPKRLVLWFYDKGKAKLTDSTELIAQYKDAFLLFIDTRGTGETTDKVELNDPKYFNKEYRNALLGIHCGKSLVEQRTADILMVLQYFSYGPAFEQIPIEINASGVNCIPALHAIALSGRLTEYNLKKLNLYDCIPSFRTILERPAEKNWYSYIIPNVLNFYDIPDLVDLVGKQRVNFIQQ